MAKTTATQTKTTKTATKKAVSDIRELTPKELTHADIAVRAYELYLARGAEGGDEVSDWLQAETELKGL